MKYTFVLDKCVIRFAQGLYGENDIEDFTSAHLLLEICKNCHRIAVDPDTMKSYYKITSTEKGNQTTKLQVAKILEHLYHNNQKHKIIEKIPKYPLEDQVPEEDRNLVGLAVISQAFFVTADRRLRKILESIELPTRTNIRILNPQEAMEYAQSIDP